MDWYVLVVKCVCEVQKVYLFLMGVTRDFENIWADEISVKIFLVL